MLKPEKLDVSLNKEYLDYDFDLDDISILGRDDEDCYTAVARPMPIKSHAKAISVAISRTSLNLSSRHSSNGSARSDSISTRSAHSRASSSDSSTVTNNTTKKTSTTTTITAITPTTNPSSPSATTTTTLLPWEIAHSAYTPSPFITIPIPESELQDTPPTTTTTASKETKLQRRKSTFARVLTSVVSVGSGGIRREAQRHRMVRMPREEYLKYWARDAKGVYVGSEPEGTGRERLRGALAVGARGGGGVSMSLVDSRGG